MSETDETTSWTQKIRILWGYKRVKFLILLGTSVLLTMETLDVHTELSVYRSAYPQLEGFCQGSSYWEERKVLPICKKVVEVAPKFARYQNEDWRLEMGQELEVHPLNVDFIEVFLLEHEKFTPLALELQKEAGEEQLTIPWLREPYFEAQILRAKAGIEQTKKNRQVVTEYLKTLQENGVTIVYEPPFWDNQLKTLTMLTEESTKLKAMLERAEKIGVQVRWVGKKYRIQNSFEPIPEENTSSIVNVNEDWIDEFWNIRVHEECFFWKEKAERKGWTWDETSLNNCIQRAQRLDRKDPIGISKLPNDNEGNNQNLQKVFDKSIEVAKSIYYDSDKSEALSTIALELSKSGLSTEELVPLFEKSLEVANSISNDSWKFSVLSTIAKELSKSGLFEKSLEVANSISNRYGHKSSALSTIAEELSKSGLFEKSLEVANSINDDSWKSSALSTIALELSKSGMFEKSLEVANSIRDNSYFYDNNNNRVYAKSRALSTIAKELSKSGFAERSKEVFEKSLEVANSISSDRYKSSALWTIVEELSKSGLSTEELVPLFEKSLEVANSISNEEYKSETLSTIASELSKSGFKERSKEVFEKSIEVANSISYDVYKSSALSRIAEELSKSGFAERSKEVFEKSLEVANSIRDSDDKSSALWTIVEELSKSGLSTEELVPLFEKSLEVANSISDEGNKSSSLSTIASELSKSGFAERSKEVFEKSLEVANSISSDRYKSSVFSTLGVELLKSGLHESTKGSSYISIFTELGDLTYYLSPWYRRIFHIPWYWKDLFTGYGISGYTSIKPAQSKIVDEYHPCSLYVNRLQIPTHCLKLKPEQLHSLAQNRQFFLEFEKENETSEYNVELGEAFLIAVLDYAKEHKATSKTQVTTYHTLQSWPFAPFSKDNTEIPPSEMKQSELFTAHMSNMFSILDNEKQVSLLKSLQKISKASKISGDVRPPNTCLIEGISVQITEDIYDFIVEHIDIWKQSEALRKRYGKLGGVITDSEQGQWYGERRSIQSQGNCSYTYIEPTLSKEQIEAWNKKLSQWETETTQLKKIIQRANRLQIDTSNWHAPYQLQVWTSIVEDSEGLEQRANAYIQKAHKMGVDVKNSVREDRFFFAAPYTESKMEAWEKEIARVEVLFEKYQQLQKAARKVGYRFPQYFPLDLYTEEHFSKHEHMIENTLFVRKVLQSVRMISVPASKGIKGFSMAHIELQEDVIHVIAESKDPPKAEDVWMRPTAISRDELDDFFYYLRLMTGKNYRLPNQEEWIHAARAGQDTYFSGSYSADEVGWNNGNSLRVMASALKKPNAWGFYDMSGNVAEWVWDGKDDYSCMGGGVNDHSVRTCVTCADNESTSGIRLVLDR